MKVVLDTNVIVSGLFFGGTPGRILSAWHAGHVTLVLSASILAEYREVGAELGARYGELDFESFAALLVMNSEVIGAPEYFPDAICGDTADDKSIPWNGYPDIIAERTSKSLGSLASTAVARVDTYRRGRLSPTLLEIAPVLQVTGSDIKQRSCGTPARGFGAAAHAAAPSRLPDLR